MRKLRYAVFLFSLFAAVTPMVSAADGDDAAIRKVHTDFEAAWNRHDAAAMAAMWSEDGDLINPEGRTGKGRAEVQKIFVEEQSGGFKSTTFRHTINSVRNVAPTVAVVEASYEIANATPPAAGGPTTLKGFYQSVMVKKGGKWWIASAMAMAPVPMSPGSAR